MKKILIVEDEEDVRNVLTDFLADEGYIMLQAGDGLQGIEVAKKELPDLVLLDMRLPKMSGLDVIRELRANQPNVPILVLSGVKDLETAKQALRLGAYDYVVKPIQLETLLRDYVTPLLGEEGA